MIEWAVWANDDDVAFVSTVLLDPSNNYRRSVHAVRSDNVARISLSVSVESFNKTGA